MPKLDRHLAEALENSLLRTQDTIRDVLLPQYLGSTVEGADALAEQVRIGTALFQRGIQPEAALETARVAMSALLGRHWDDAHTGWLQDDSAETKTAGLHAEILAALAEFTMATGDYQCSERMAETFQTIQTFFANNRSGGYIAECTRDWVPIDSTVDTTHTARLFEALTLCHEASGLPIYRRRAVELGEQASRSAEDAGALQALLSSASRLDESDCPWLPSVRGQIAGLGSEFSPVVFLEAWSSFGDAEFLQVFAAVADAELSIRDLIRQEHLLLRALL